METAQKLMERDLNVFGKWLGPCQYLCLNQFHFLSCDHISRGEPFFYAKGTLVLSHDKSSDHHNQILAFSHPLSFSYHSFKTSEGREERTEKNSRRSDILKRKQGEGGG